MKPQRRRDRRDVTAPPPQARDKRSMHAYFDRPGIETRTVFYESVNPYTRGLMSSIPNFAAREHERLDPIPGSPPSPSNFPSGCVFRPRCPHVVDRCKEERPALMTVEGSHRTRCHVWDRLPALETAEAAS